MAARDTVALASAPAAGLSACERTCRAEAPAERKDADWNGLAFFLCGLCNNFSYCIAISAAVDILKGGGDEGGGSEGMTSYVYLANIVPSLFAKFAAPFVAHLVPYGARISLMSFGSFVALQAMASGSTAQVRLIGVAISSFGHGIGEGSLLALTTLFPPKCMAALAPGFASAGLSTATLWLVLTSWVGLKARAVLWWVSLPPSLTYVFAYFFLLSWPGKTETKKTECVHAGAAELC